MKKQQLEQQRGRRLSRSRSRSRSRSPSRSISRSRSRSPYSLADGPRSPSPQRHKSKYTYTKCLYTLLTVICNRCFCTAARFVSIVSTISTGTISATLAISCVTLLDARHAYRYKWICRRRVYETGTHEPTASRSRRTEISTTAFHVCFIRQKD